MGRTLSRGGEGSIMTDSEIEELHSLAKRITHDAHNMNLYQRWETLLKAAKQLEQAYALIKQLKEQVREWPSN